MMSECHKAAFDYRIRCIAASGKFVGLEAKSEQVEIVAVLHNIIPV